MIETAWQWLGENANPISAFATALATAFAAAGLWFSGLQARQAARSTDFDTLVHLDETVRALEQTHRVAVLDEDPAAARRARTDLYNRFEILASGVRHKLLTRQSRDYAEGLLVDLLALEEYSGGHLQLGLQQGDSLEDVEWFVKSHRMQINKRKAEYKRQDSERASSQ